MWKDNKTIKPYDVRVSEFSGLSRLPVVKEGQLKVSRNMVFDNYPVMSVRKGRTLTGTVTGTPQAILAVNGVMAVAAGNRLYYDGKNTGITLSAGNKSMVEFWGKIFIFPDGKYYDIANGTYGNIGSGTYPDNGSCPEMDYVVVHNNRIWGCKGNHIYASSLGNAMGDSNPNSTGDDKSRSDYGWTYFVDDDGNPAEAGSFTVDSAIDGDFMGIISWDNRIVCLGERNHLEVYGEYPSNFSLRSITKYGTINHHSIQEVNARLFYVSRSGVFLYSGGLERDISRDLNEIYENAVAGTDGVRYYLSLRNSTGHKLYVYHTMLDCWTEEDSPDIIAFTQQEGYIYALCTNGNILKLNDEKSTERVHWEFAFNDDPTAIYNNTTVKNLKLKLKSPANAYVVVNTSSDDKEAPKKRLISFPNKTLQNVEVGIPRGAEHSFTVTGEGPIEVYGYQYSFVDGGDQV